MREHDDECFTEDESVAEPSSLSAMRSGFKALYDELDRLGEQATLTVESIEQERASEKEALNKEDIADLIRYARTFIRETRKTFVTVDEHGVQCGPERRSNKKVSTPKAWKQPIVVERTVEREVLTVCENRRRSAVTVIQQTVPRDDAGALSDDPEVGRVTMSTAGERSIQTEPLNNTVAVETLPEMQSEKYPDAAKDHTAHLENVVTEQVEQAEPPPQEPDSVEPALVQVNGGEEDSTIPEKDKNHNEAVEKSTTEEKASDTDEKAGESLGFTSHILPSLSIKGRWDANLKVQQTGSIAIVDPRDTSCDKLQNDNVKYVELNQGLPVKHLNTDIRDGAAEDIKQDLETDIAPKRSKLRVEVADKPGAHSNSESENTATEVTSSGEEAGGGLPMIRIPRSVCKLTKHNNKPNKYLDPFVSRKRKEYSTKNRPEVSLDIVDEDSSCSSTEDDHEEDDIRVLLNWKDDRSSETSDSVSREAVREKTLPTSVQCQRSLLEVSSIPALRSPAELSRAAVDGTSESDHDPTFSGQSSSRFLDNLRIWKSAVDIQSRNMKMSNELAEDLAALKDNLQKIAEESAKVVKIAQNVKSSVSNVVEESYPAQCVPMRPATSASSARRSKSCECFGCQHTFEERPASSRPAFSSPPYDYKKFQRTVFESNPRYAKTIRKICEFGGREKTLPAARPERDESVRKAAQKFLQSLQGNTITERSCCSSRSSPVLLRSPSKSVSSRSDGLLGTVDYDGLVISENEYDTDSEVASVCSSSTCDTPFSGDTKSNGSSAGQIGTSEGTDLSSLTSNFHAQCDLGEVLSPGEIK
ncbi:uncharacterized protein LOC120898364 [Anopheles arabiensis]|uniref:uncharacterized protein LOC120898364 n=1 Tax=Anopheles arabiensis TaxID=7173 RepID=UPI001AADB03C|nr:uncharacterized protein LOC120898364 [Anopheles arabiensis]